MKVYNFEVEDWHTYYVVGVEVLVHNKCSIDWDDYDNYSSKNNKKPKKGKEFRGGSKKDRDKWYGKMIKSFKNGGKESGSPKANGGK